MKSFFKISNFSINLKNNLFLLLILPYVIYTLPTLLLSDLSNKIYLCFILFIAFILNYFFQMINNKYIKVIIINLIVIIFYSLLILPFLSKLSMYFMIKVRYFFVFFLVLLNLLLFLLHKKYHFFSIIFIKYLFILNILLLISSLYLYKSNMSNNKIDIPIDKNFGNRIISDASILLIILDEYGSPFEINKLKHNTRNYSFSKKVKSEGWIVKDSFYSYETKTIKSISSLFNLNLSNNNEFKKRNYKYCDIFLKNTTLISNLELKNVDFINWGIFKINEHTPVSIDIYPFPKNFSELFFSNTILSFLLNNFNYNNLNEKPSYYHNNKIFNLFENFIIPQRKFIYSHLLMPHAPFDFNSEFKYDYTKSYDYNYINYWNFTNIKLTESLIHLKRNNPRLKIIITGDHGYRDNISINSNYTFGAFYGFSSNELKYINSVQDIGKLIFYSF